MDPDSDPDLSLFIAVMTLVIGVMPLFIGVMTLIRGLVLRLMASLIVHASQIVYITGMWSELKYTVQRSMPGLIDCLSKMFFKSHQQLRSYRDLWLRVRLDELGIDLGPWVHGNTPLGRGYLFL